MLGAALLRRDGIDREGSTITRGPEPQLAKSEEPQRQGLVVISTRHRPFELEPVLLIRDQAHVDQSGGSASRKIQGRWDPHAAGDRTEPSTYDCERDTRTVHVLHIGDSGDPLKERLPRSSVNVHPTPSEEGPVASRPSDESTKRQTQANLGTQSARPRIWRDYDEARSGFIYGARFDLGVDPTTYLKIVPEAGSTAIAMNLTGFYVGEECDVMRIEVATIDGEVHEFSHSSRAMPGAWSVPDGNGFLGIVADSEIQYVRINIVESVTFYTYDFLILDNVMSGVVLNSSAVGHTPSEFNGCNPDSYPFAGFDNDPVATALLACEADLVSTESKVQTCEQDLASALASPRIEYVEVPVEVIKVVEVERIVNVCEPPSETQTSDVPNTSRSRSGLADGTNPGRGDGRSRAPKSGWSNPTARK